ncbi:MAG TPA: hypothetical protein VNN08_16240 [Thermoanaerobaculia bacterium]|nr:hypothetical protein [Thermoanaerobaculia bacterium]
MTAPLTREAILATHALKTETVDIPEWGGAVIVSELTGKEKDAWEVSMLKRKGKREFEPNLENARAKLLVRAIRTPTGERMFGDSDIDALGQLGAGPLSRLYEVAQRLSGLTDQDLEELAGNSASGSADGSPSGSPATSASSTSMPSSAS